MATFTNKQGRVSTVPDDASLIRTLIGTGDGTISDVPPHILAQIPESILPDYLKQPVAPIATGFKVEHSAPSIPDFEFNSIFEELLTRFPDAETEEEIYVAAVSTTGFELFTEEDAKAFLEYKAKKEEYLDKTSK